MLGVAPVFAGQADTDLAEVVVVGKRASLATAQDIKRDKLEIVDSVVADEINKLPDINVTDALSRVSGVQILRDRGEGAGVAIRGLTQMETWFNGREVFTAGNGRNLDFADIPAEMLAGLDVYKTSSANQIEGGVGGVIDLRTHRPFDFEGRKFAASARGIYGDRVDDAKPQLSALASQRWQTQDWGEFGALVNLAWQQRAWREDQHSFGNPMARSDLMAGRTVIVPNGAIDTVTVGERERIGGSVVLQWRPSDRWDLYAELHHSQFKTWQDGYQLFMNPPANFAASDVSLVPGSNDVAGVSWINPTVSNWGSARDTVDRTTQWALGGSWNRGPLTLTTDLSYTRSHNHLFYSVITRDGSAATLTQDVAGARNSLSGVVFDKAGMVYADRPFDGDLWAWRADGEYRAGGWLFDTISAGVRYARRWASDAPGQVSVYQPAVTAVDNAAGLFVDSRYSAYPVGSPAAARDVAAVRGTLGLVSALPDGNPLGTWNIREQTLSAYLINRFEPDAWPVDGSFGVRLVHSRETLAGFQSLVGGGIGDMESNHAYVDWLPSINLRYRIGRDWYARAAISQSLTRPDFNQLSPSLTLNSAQHSGSAGNPGLEPVRSDNFDVAVEYYFGRGNSLYLSGFAKQVDGFVATVSGTEVHGGESYQVSRPRNLNTAAIRGFEAGYQQFYDFLPGWLNGLGLQANYTYVDSETVNGSLGLKTALQNLSKHSYNLIGIYERGPFSARVAYNWRDRFVGGIANIAGVGALPIITEGYGWLDASLAYRFDSHCSLTLEGMNLLNTLRRSYFGAETRPQSVWGNDVQVAVSLSVRY